MSQTEITIPKPYDAHVHLRDGKMLRDVLPFTSCVFPRAVVMGNLPDPVDDAARMIAYRDEILLAEPGFQPIMSIMLTRRTTVETINAAWKAGAKVLKFIPGGVSTGGTDSMGLADLPEYFDVLAAVRDRGMIFSCHCELSFLPATGDPLPKNRQEMFAGKYLSRVVKGVPGLRLVVEHVSSRELISFVQGAPSTVTATITAHHAVLVYEDVCNWSDKVIAPLNYCKPVPKSRDDRRAVRAAMVSGNPKFFFGSDSAPHLLEKKKGPTPAAGVFTGPIALNLICRVFEEESKLYRLGDFMSVFGPRFYDLPPSEGTVTIKKEPWFVPFEYEGVPIFLGGQEMKWKVC